ncbi:MAG: flagellar basal body rod protein FlgB [Rickettsiaceae bacterium H1]|nr:flagellar basal body rod protein FlgB [Rickettsiaceae bacterium H1]
MLNNIKAIDLIKKKLNYVSERHNLIANNIANVNTPGKKAKDLSPFSLAKPKITIACTGKKHMSNNKHTKFKIFYPETEINKLDGNNIGIEQESMKMSENNLEQQKTVSLYNKLISMFNVAMKNGK